MTQSVGSRFWGSAYVLLSFTALFWAGNSIVGRAARDLVPPASLAFWRWTFAFLILLPIAWPHLRRDRRKLLRCWKSVVLLGALGVGAFNTLLYTGLQDTTALNALLLQSAQPALILLLGVLLFRDRAGVLQVIAVIVSIAGVATIIARGDLAVLARLEFHHGDVVIGASVVVWSLYSALLRLRPKVHPLSFLAATMGVGVCVVFPFYVAELLAGRFIVPGTGSVLAIGYVSIFPSVISYLFFNRGVELIGASATGLYINVMPILGAGLAILFLGETLQPFHFVGMLLVGAGIALAGWGDRRTASTRSIA